MPMLRNYYISRFETQLTAVKERLDSVKQAKDSSSSSMDGGGGGGGFGFYGTRIAKPLRGGGGGGDASANGEMKRSSWFFDRR